MFRSKSNLSILILSLIAVIIGASVIVSSQNNQNRAEISSPTGLKQKPDNLKVPQNNPNQPNPGSKNIPNEIPDDVTYRQIFKHLEELNKKADNEERAKGKDGKKYRNLYKDTARLNEKQARTLDRVADQTYRELKKVDDRAKQVIDQIRAQTPNHRIERGQKPPLPTQELSDLSKQRKDVTLKAVNELRTNFGEAEFVRFSQFVNEKVKTGIRKKSGNARVQKGGPAR